MVTTGYNGIIYPEKNIKSLEDAVQWMLDHKSNIYEIKKNYGNNFSCYDFYATL